MLEFRVNNACKNFLEIRKSPKSIDCCVPANGATADGIPQQNVFSSTLKPNLQPSQIADRQHIVQLSDCGNDLSAIEKITSAQSEQIESTLASERLKSSKALGDLDLEEFHFNLTQKVAEILFGLEKRIEVQTGEKSCVQSGKRRNEDEIDGNCAKRLSSGSDGTMPSECSNCGHTNRKQFLCETCGYQSFNKRDYKRHLIIEHGFKFPFECAVCQEGFDNVDELNAHESRSKVYQCSVCEKSFKHRKHDLTRHMRTH